MVGIQSLVSALLLASSAVARPAHPSFPPFVWKTELCKLSPFIRKALCPRDTSASPTSVDTPIGTAQGASDSSGATRFAVKYASASRWELPQIASAWELP